MLLVFGSLCGGGSFLQAQNGQTVDTDTKNESNATKFEVYQLQHQSPTYVKTLLQGFLKDQADRVETGAIEEQQLLIVRGPEEVHQLVADLIKKVDKKTTAAPGKKPAELNPALNSAPLAEQSMETIRCRPDSLLAAQQIARKFLETEPGSKVTIEPQNSLLLVLASPRKYQELNQKLTAARLLVEKTALVNVPGASRNNRAEAGRNIEDMYYPRYHSADRLEQKIQQLLGKRLIRDPQRTAGRYQIQSRDGARLTLEFQSEQNRLFMTGREGLVDQFAELVHSLDSSTEVGAAKVSIVPVRNSKPETVRKAIKAYMSGYRAEQGAEAKPAVPEGEPQSMVAPQKEGIQQINFQNGLNPNNLSFQIEGNPNDLDMDLDDEARLRSRLGELSNNVQIQTLDDLDLIILRGRDEDVQEISRIIEQIEQLSIDAEPEIEVIPLKHVSGRSLEALANQISEQLVGGRQGRAFVTALGNPNSILLIGWGEAFGAMKELVERLDEPVDPESEMQLFALEHADATAAMQSVLQFFTPQGGLSPTVNVITDNRTNSLIVRGAPRDLLQVSALIKRLDLPGGEAVNQVRTYKLKNTLANDLAAVIQEAINAARGQGAGGKSKVLELLTVDAEGEKLLKTGALQDVRITPDPRTNTLIISAPEDSLALLDALIDQLDREPTEQAQIKVFRIVNGDAASLIQMLRALIPSSTGLALGPQLPGSGGETSLIPLRFSIDERTNSIIASGSTNDLALIEALLIRLDAKDVLERKTTVYKLRNAPAFDVYEAINEFLRDERRVREAATEATNRFLQVEREVVVVSEEVSNSIILSATPEYYDRILGLIKELDEQPPMVMIQVLIAELALNDTDEFGVELGLQDSLLFDRSLLGDLLTTTNTTQVTNANGVTTITEEIIQGATNQPGFDFNNNPLGNSGSTKSLSTAGDVAGQAISHFDVGRVNSQLGFGGLVLSAGSENINILVRALKESRRLDVLSRPQIMTLDNQPAFIQVGERVPRVVNTTLNQFGQVNTVELENVGLIVAVTPRISPEGNVVMEIDAEKSELGSEAEGIPISTSADGEVLRSPRINLTTASTTVSADNGETIILGGLITKSTSKVARRVPYLADIPILGDLFRFDSRAVRRTELMIILTPYIINNPQDMERLKQIEEARMHWCAADISAIHYDTGYCLDGSCDLETELQVIFPDDDPRGVMPPPETLNMQPTPIPGSIAPPDSIQPMMMQEDQVFRQQVSLPNEIQPVVSKKQPAWWQRKSSASKTK
ncbi:Type II secretion system protein D precursor [Polystyrenella longa]|uniref:Type II secretion system protein D n=2 Tax=Polystyrenella longa TaxID=2528007 RepID=A0A518CH94_9PLAN|nr:Type II secretion system protein D precursor [Polystyrenella longa]